MSLERPALSPSERRDAASAARPAVLSAAVPAPPAQAEPLVALTSSQLFHGARQIFIRHGDAVYQLRITSQDKLILTK